ncbi:MAG: hypothetical protein H7Y04_12765 [Verrucomicrobia bacterium]|nr:hypothetical protein [Cytophagales bacterium]
MQSEPTFLKRNGLSLVLLSCFLIFWAGQAYTGWQEHNKERSEAGQTEIHFSAYLRSGHFASTTFENWESEFFQLFIYVFFTIYLRQKGSAESKSLTEKEDSDREPVAHAKAPWAVKQGGIWLKLYKNSLTIAFISLFFLSLLGHIWGSYKTYSEEQIFKNESIDPLSEYLTQSHFWFESFQNWQSEFLAVLSIVVLTIFLRQHGSPESKPVDAPNSQTGKEEE